MTMESTDTNRGDNPLPDGRRTFCVGHVKRITKSSGDIYIWTLAYDGGEGVQILLPNMMGGLLRVLGATEVSPGKFDWETDLMDGKYFEATVSHGVDAKGVMRQNMTDFAKITGKEDDVPF